MIEVKNLSKSYGSKLAVDGISFTAGESEILGFLGPNGAGKSTTMNMLTGYLSSSGGQALINGVDILEDPVRAKKDIGYLPELPPLYLDMTVMEYLNFVYDLKKCRLPKRSHLDEICRLVKITDVQKRVIRNLSKGYKQRVGLAQALVGNPKVLILDEPTAGLDPAGCRQIMDNIRDYRERTGSTVIVVSHSMDDVARFTERLIVFDHSHVVMDGTPAEVFSQPEKLCGIGLAVPQATRIAMALKARGIALPESIYTCLLYTSDAADD